MPFKVTPEEKEELLCTFAALLLHDDKIAVTADNITKVIKAAGADVEPYWPKLFSSLLEGRNVDELLLSAAGSPGAGGAGAAAPAAGGAAPAAAAKKEEEKPKEKEEEEEADLGFSLFD